MKVQGFILIDVDAAALNNAGVVSRAGIENTVETKKIIKEGRSYPYVSGQAWGYWWRNTLQNDFSWNLSPVFYDKEKGIAYTEANPFEYPDDDMFGYMRAAKEIVRDKKSGEPIKAKNGKEKTEDATVTRIAPLKNSALIAIGNTQIARNFSSMSRQNDFPVPYGKEEYSAIMKGMFSIDIDQVGTFSSYNKTGFKNLNDNLKEELQKKCTVIEDSFVVDKDKKKEKLLRMDVEIRKKRIEETIKALKTINGGAMQTNNMVDVTPKFIVLALTKSGNHPFSHIVSTDPVHHDQSIFGVEDFKEVLNEYKDDFIGNVYVGKRGGFWNEYNCDLDDLNNFSYNGENQKVFYLPVNQAIDSFCKEINELIK